MFKPLILLGLSAVLASAASLTGVVSFSPNLVFPASPPSSLRSGSLESNTTVFGFVERVNYVLAASVPVDIVPNGPATYNNPLALNPGSLPVGTALTSYFLHFDPTGNFGLNKNPGLVQIEFTPYSRIMGVQLSMNRLGDAANAQFQMPGVTYEDRILRAYGLELLFISDYVQLTSSNSLQINLNASLGTIDELRILVQTPEPGTAVLFGSAMALLLWTGRRAFTRAPGTHESTSNSDSGL
jgi:hypothetical protein